MNISKQIISLLFSSFMGIVLFLISYINYCIVKNKKLIYKYILTVICIIDFSLAYLIGLFYINDGVIHIYFIMVVAIFFCCSVKLMPRILKTDNFFKGK